ncbi:MAG: permease prefix domain 1-containing protein, partial [Lachnospiraceae bacterium]|nr:permease prefix domain 1-containing protein [Lachnospiraceae bacterium]
MEEYIDKLISQIRCKKARPYIEEEYRAHLEDQINANKEEGMADEEAEKNAVLDMGDPVEVGISMDKIHRPRVAWDIILIVGIISVLAIIVQWIFVSQISNGNYTIDGISQYTTLTGEINSAGEAINTTFGYIYSFSIGDFILNVIFGIVLMGMVYFLDYTAIAKYSKVIGSFIIVAGLYSLLFGTRVNGTYFGLGPVKISATTLMMMFVPIFGAIIFKYHGGGAISLLKCIIWLIV